MLKTGTRMLMLTIILAASSFVVAETTTASNTIATQVESRLADVVPNTVIISVDEKGRIARLSGTVSSQTEMDRITEMVRGVDGVRVISSDLRVHPQAATMRDMTTHDHETERPATSDMDHSSTPDRSTVGDETTETHMEMDHSKMADSSLVTQIDGRFMDISPDTLIVIVDESTNTAYVRGNLATQAQVENINSMLTGMNGLRVAGSNFTAGGRTIIGSGITTETTQKPKLSGGISGTDSDEEEDTIAVTTAVPDATLRAAVEEALKSEGIMGQSKIAVETENGVVTLTGAALSESQADRIVALAMSVPGVVRVEPNLTLRDQKRRYQVKPSADRDKKGFEADSPESRVPETREGDVDVDVDVDNPDTEDDDDNER